MVTTTEWQKNHREARLYLVFIKCCNFNVQPEYCKNHKNTHLNVTELS